MSKARRTARPACRSTCSRPTTCNSATRCHCKFRVNVLGVGNVVTVAAVRARCCCGGCEHLVRRRRKTSQLPASYPALTFVSTNRVRIVTDSACDLPQSVADELGIEIVPLTIRIDGNEYVDRRDLTVAEFWAKCAASPTLPETAAPAPGPVRDRPIANCAADGAEQRRDDLPERRAVGHDAVGRARGSLRRRPRSRSR